MARIVIIGDGPAGLSAALFLAKAGNETIVYAQDETLMHHAELHNYLGVPVVAGSEFQERARAQVAEFGAEIRGEAVTGASASNGGVEVQLEGGGTERGDYLVIAGGKSSQELATAAGADKDGEAVSVDANGRTSVDRVYAAGHLVRPERSQAIISAGVGAAVALDILAREAGRDVHDWDTPSS